MVAGGGALLVGHVAAAGQNAEGGARQLVVDGLSLAGRDDVVMGAAHHHHWKLGYVGEEVQQLHRAQAVLELADPHQGRVPPLHAKGALVKVKDVLGELVCVIPGPSVSNLPNLCPEQRPHYPPPNARVAEEAHELWFHLPLQAGMQHGEGHDPDTVGRQLKGPDGGRVAQRVRVAVALVVPAVATPVAPAAGAEEPAWSALREGRRVGVESDSAVLEPGRLPPQARRELRHEDSDDRLSERCMPLAAAPISEAGSSGEAGCRLEPAAHWGEALPSSSGSSPCALQLAAAERRANRAPSAWPTATTSDSLRAAHN
eukprot:CAMPEP_0117677694 /NCGR_PEP_ID=MMETSP0804-20121206/16881_1 /TAXON_ID=1074897 /ORGANISM="Tetraselmis astigmatica, Strain CCMP880" /LENGTH=314 /DNA_ID=CAMNT_0005486993 /DNA_START=528 /DNA_END=1473 /DNA_ORIENTATION=+